ncbi:hypothetical protein QYF36_022310 [Acer negundo]|nr:hypothetical protein QYF36_022310 [Acer negundo]
MASSSYFFSFFSFFFLSLLSIFPSNSSLTIPISHFHTNPSQDPYQNLNSLVSSSLTRAFHLKNPQTTTTTTRTSVSSHSYGGYSISLSFGTPPQTIPFILDTGSHLVWFPCTTHYLCNNCSFSKIQSFIPKKSSSSKILGCQNPKCSWIHDRNLKCRDCDGSDKNCTQICPPYLVLYGSGNTGGIALSETLNLPNNRTITDFLVGCSVTSSRQPAGIAGFGRGQTSLPSQLNLNKFSFCQLSHKLDDTRRTSSLLLDTGSVSAKKTSELIYTPFININNKNNNNPREFSVYYYLGLRRITVGGRHVKIPFKYLSPENDGNGGTIIDSGTTFTFMTRHVFEPLINELVSQVKKNYSRAVDAEAKTGLSPCFDISGEKTVSGFPELKFHFKGGADMSIPVENYLAVVDGDQSSTTTCFTVVSDPPEVVTGGPAIILGNFQMQNYYVEYDLRNERLGFNQQQCQ